MHLKSVLYAGAVAAFAISAPACAADKDFPVRAEALVAATYPATGPGAAVIVTQAGKVIYAGSSGMADIAKGAPIGPDTVFRFASITKQFTAAVVLQLAAEGKLSLDDPLSKFLPGYPEPGARATVRQLLNHTSGIQSYTGIPGWMESDKVARPFTTAELVAEFRDQPAEFQPGERWNYNNSAYVLAGAVIEAVTGLPWHQAVVERIAKPLGLDTIRYGGEEAGVAGFATGYSAGDGGVFAPTRKLDMSVPHAAGGLIGTVSDLAKWAHALHHGRVVSPALYAEMIAPTALPGGGSEPYGYGLSRSTVRGLSAIGHSGGIFGFTTNSLYIPENDLFVAVLSNTDSGLTTPALPMLRLAAEAIGKPFPTFAKAEFDAAALAPAFGVYRIEGGETSRRFFLRDGQLYTQRDGAPASAVYAAGGNRYFYGPDSLNWFELTREPSGSYVMLMHQNGEDQAERAPRTGSIPAEMPAVALPREVLASYAGTYTSPVAPIVVAVREDGVLTLKFGPQPATPLRALSSNEFAAIGVEAKVVFRQTGGAVSGLVVHQGGRELTASRAAPAN